MIIVQQVFKYFFLKIFAIGVVAGCVLEVCYDVYEGSKRREVAKIYYCPQVWGVGLRGIGTADV